MNNKKRSSLYNLMKILTIAMTMLLNCTYILATSGVYGSSVEVKLDEDKGYSVRASINGESIQSQVENRYAFPAMNENMMIEIYYENTLVNKYKISDVIDDLDTWNNTYILLYKSDTGEMIYKNREENKKKKEQEAKEYENYYKTENKYFLGVLVMAICFPIVMVYLIFKAKKGKKSNKKI